MADSEDQQVTSTTTASLLNDEVHHYEPELEQPKADHFSVDDIVDLVGGAQDALERHKAEDSAPHEATETLVEEHPVTLVEPEPEPVVTSEAEPLVAPEPAPEPTPEPAPEPVVIPEPEPEPIAEEPLPDSTTIVPEPVVVEEPLVVAPKAEPEVSSIVEPEIIPEPEPVIPEPEPEPVVVPEPVVPEPAPALPVPEPRKEEAPAPAEAVTEEPPAPAAYAPSPPKAQPQPLMQFPTVVDLLYWRDVKSSGAVFGASLLLLLSLTMCSIVSVCSYIGLALLSVTICFRIYKGILQAIQKSDDGHPFKQFLDQEVALSEDMVHKYSDLALSKINKSIADLRRLFLVEDLVDSIKFAVLMWILTYVGGLFNGLTLLILAVVAAFSCPIIYEKHQEQIDHYLGLVNNQIKDVVGKIQAKVPGMKKKTE